jgi:Glycosyl transferase family 2
MIKMELAPIILFAYNRPIHLQKTIESLKNNTLAINSKVYFFSDAPKNESDNSLVKEVRNLLHQVKGFREVEIIEQSNNKGLATSVIDGVTQIINTYEKVIVLEDDLVVSSNFLKYQNDCLIKYKEKLDVFSIAGYMPPIQIPNYIEDNVFLIPRCSSWGWATWKDRWLKSDWEVKDFQDFIKDKEKQKMFERGGNDVTAMLVKQQLGVIHSWAIRWNYAHFKHDAYCLYPRFNKVANIGTDGSGTNFPKEVKKYITSITERDYHLPDDLFYDASNEVVKNFKKFYNVSLYRKCINFLKYQIW